MSGSSTEYANGLREAAKVIEIMGEEVYWVEDRIWDDPAHIRIQWHFYSRAEAEAFQDRMVNEFHPTWVRTEQPTQWGAIKMDIPQCPTISVEISFYDRPED